MFRKTRIGAAALLVFTAVGALLGFIWLRTSLPQTTGTILVADLGTNVEIVRDKKGIPHIFAENTADAAFALGFAHAQDRLWQMEFMRRTGAGRLSEIIGPETLPTDKFLRTLGIYRLAEKQAETLPTDVSETLDAYVRGVNAFIENHDGAWPIEFIILGHRPEPWQPADTLVWAKLMGLRLSTGWRGDLLRAALAKKLGPARVEQLFPLEQAGDPTTLSRNRHPDIPRLDWLRIAAAIPEGLKSDSASNAWVLSGTRTKSGMPILANDPHLEFSAPGIWYLARIVTPNFASTGATVPGVPLTILGQNGHIAWGMTTPGADTSDIYIEDLDPNNSAQYVTSSGPRRFQTRQETIRIRGETPVDFVIRSSRHGPIISDVIPHLANLGGTGKVLALSATILDTDDSTVSALAQMNRAKSLNDFRVATQSFDAPMQNLFGASRTGEIGFATAGKMPVRDGVSRHLPIPGNSHDSVDESTVPFVEWPQAWDPPTGLIANANNRIRAGTRRYPHASYWPASYRLTRIFETFQYSRELTVEDSVQLQLDRQSVAARKLVPYLLGIEPVEAIQARAVELLKDWNFEMARDRPEPLIYTAWIRHLMATIFADELGDVFPAYGRTRPRILLRTLREDLIWCDDNRSPTIEKCADQTLKALIRATTELREKYGDDPDKWRWGEAHQAIFSHRILRHIPILSTWADGRVATGGGDQTLTRGQTGGPNSDPYRHSHGAAYRAVYDLGNPENSRFSLATGQSGNPLSDHYMSLLEEWRDGRYFRIFGSQDELMTRGGDRLVLQPSKGKTDQ